MKRSYLINLFCLFFFLQSITDYFHIQKHLPFLPFSDAGLALLNNYFGFFLIVVSFLGRKRLNIFHKQFTIPLIIFIIYTILNNYMLGIPKADFISLRFVKFGMLYLLVILVVRNENDLIKILKTIVVIMLFKLLVLSFSQAEQNFKLLLFSTMTIITPVALLLVVGNNPGFSVKNRLTKLFLIFVTLLPLLSGQRRALVGLGVLAILMMKKMGFSVKFVITSIVSGLALIIIINFIEADLKQRYSTLFNIDQISEFFNEEGDAYKLTSGRKDIWRVYWQKALKSPILGNGYGVTKQNYGQLSRAHYVL